MFAYDQSLLKGKLGYDRDEEKRRQRWVFNLNNPATTQVKELMQQVQKKGLTFDQFAERISKTYRETSMTIHHALRVYTSKKPLSFKVSSRISRNEAIDILMEDVEVASFVIYG